MSALHEKTKDELIQDQKLIARWNMKFKEFDKLAEDWNLSPAFYHAMQKGLIEGLTHATLSTSNMTKVDSRWCKAHGFIVEIDGDEVRVKL